LNKGLKQTIQFIVFFAVGIFLLWIAFRNVEFNRLIRGLKDADYKWVVLSLLFATLAYISRARRWAILIDPLGYKPAFSSTFYALMTGYMANLALPRIGEITRCVALGRKEKIPVDQLIGTVVIERTIDFLTLVSILTGLIFSRGEQVNQFLKVSIFIPLREKVFSVFGAAWILWILLAFIFLSASYLIIRHRKQLRKNKLFAKFFDLAKGIINGLKTIISLNHKWEFIFHTIFIWINYTLMTWVVVFAIDPTSHLTLGDGVFLLVIGGLAMSAPVQSGLGAFHYIISRGLAFVKGVKIEDGLIYAFLTHESQMLLVIIVGTLSFFMIFRKNSSESPSF
jgi:uncharacterized protein (TIRG00374 family)